MFAYMQLSEYRSMRIRRTRRRPSAKSRQSWLSPIHNTRFHSSFHSKRSRHQRLQQSQCWGDKGIRCNGRAAFSPTISARRLAVRGESCNPHARAHEMWRHMIGVKRFLFIATHKCLPVIVSSSSVVHFLPLRHVPFSSVTIPPAFNCRFWSSQLVNSPSYRFPCF